MRGRWGLLAAVAVILLFGAEGCTVLGSTYDRKVSEADNLARQLGALQKKHDALTAENGELKARIAKLSSDLADMTGQRDKLSSDLADMTGRRDKLADDNKELDKVLKSKTDSLSTTIVELRRKVADLEAENGKLKSSLASLQAENAKLKGDIANLQKVKEEVVQKSSTYEKMLEQMKGEIAKGEVTISELKGKLTVNMVDAILFDSGKSEVKPEGLEVLKKVVAVLEPVKDKAIRIEGHTDNVAIRGTLAKIFPTNWELSAARAINVTRYLQQQGIDPAVLSAVAYGEHKPVAANDTPEGKAKNRRIEIVLVPKE